MSETNEATFEDGAEAMRTACIDALEEHRTEIKRALTRHIPFMADAVLQGQLDYLEGVIDVFNGLTVRP